MGDVVDRASEGTTVACWCGHKCSDLSSDVAMGMMKIHKKREGH